MYRGKMIVAFFVALAWTMAFAGQRIEVTDENAGTNCTYAGKKIQVFDDNNTPDPGDDTLLDTDYVCNGAPGTNGNDGSDGHNALVNITNEPAGSNCANGGKKIESGLDNGDGGGIADNGILEAGEVDATNYVCNGLDGADGQDGADGTDGFTSITVTDDQVGANCDAYGNGGTRIRSGLDNGDGGGNPRNGTLEDGEVDSTAYICNGADGADGSDGANGHNALVNITTEPAGSNCTAGGKKIESGIDDGLPTGTADNGILDAGEVDATTYICNGVDGANGHNALVNITIEPAGSNCTAGGKKIESGIDLNDNGTLDAGEITDTDYICNGLDGADGSNGHSSLANVTDEPAGLNCENGGKKIETGVDLNDNGVLDAGEIVSSFYVCNGINGSNGTGYNALVAVTNEPEGVNCANGGKKIETGLDVNSNGTLDPLEVNDTDYVCNGANGIDGTSGHNSITQIDNSVGTNCDQFGNGGLRIRSGIDLDDDNTLDDTEVTSEAYLCNGANGEDGANGTSCTVTDNGDGTKTIMCEDGTSVTVSDGTDGANGADGQDGTDGEDGKNALVAVSDEPAGENCENGGKKIETGIDDDGDGVLDPEEVDDTEYVCNGTDGQDGQDGTDGETGPQGAQGEPGQDGEDGTDGSNALVNVSPEEPGENCENGGIKIETGTDYDNDGILGVNEVANTRYVCNGADGATADQIEVTGGGGCSLVTTEAEGQNADGMSALVTLLLLAMAFSLRRATVR